jgi:uncharacterized protein (DUF342 family)
MPVTAPAAVEGKLELAPDKRSALLKGKPAALQHAWDLDEVLKRLKLIGVRPTDEVEAQARAACDPATRTFVDNQTVLIARGVDPVHDQPARFEPARAGGPAQAPVVCAAGDPVARLIPQVIGHDGVDLLGGVVKRHVVPLADLPPLDPSVKLDADGTSVVAAIDGLVSLDPAGLPRVQPVRLVEGNVDPTTGSIQSDGAVVVRGSVRDTVRLAAEGQIYVGGAIEAADVIAGGDLTVAGGVVCRDKGRVLARARVSAKFVVNTHLDATGDVNVHSEIASSHVKCGGRVAVAAGPILASVVQAIGGAECQELGASSHVKTVLAIGVDPDFIAKVRATMPVIDANRKRIAKVRETVEPLLRHQKSLTSAQKEKATELLYDADSLQHETDKLQSALVDEYRAIEARAKLEVVVHGTVFPGVTIRFPGVETTVRLQMKGPVRIACIEQMRHPRIVVYVGDSDTPHPLEMRTTDCPAMDALRRIIHGDQPAGARHAA